MCLYDIIQTMGMLSKLGLKLLPCDAKELTGHVAMHYGHEVLEFMSVGLQFTYLEFVEELAVLQAVEGLF